MKVKLSAMFNDVRGKDGTLVVRRSRSGLVATPRTTPKNPKSVAQVGSRNALSKGSRGFANLSAANANAWNAYGSTIVKRNRVNGTSYSSTGIDIYNALTSKFLQMNPTGTPPSTPPTSAFLGDSITLTAGGAAGQVSFVASAASATNVKVELLLQPMKGKNRAPGSRGYKSRAFAVFSAGTLTSNVPATPGVYAAAVRFVNNLTGQATALTPLSVVTVS